MGEAHPSATLKVGGGPGAAPPGGRERGEPSSSLVYTEHNCNGGTSPAITPPKIGRVCGRWTMVGHSAEKVAHSRFRCKSYTCAICGPRKLRRVRKAIVRHAVAKDLYRFVTLTLDPKKLPPGLTVQQMVVYLRACWSKMRVSIQRRLSRTTGKSLVFIAVVELHASGVPHLHVLVDSYFPQAWVSQAWQAVGGGQIVDIRAVEIRRVSAYLSKYITKEKMLDNFPKGVRRFSTSRGLSLFERSKGDGSWGLATRAIEEFYATANGIDKASEKYEIDPYGAVQLTWFEAALSPLVLRRSPLHLNRTGKKISSG